MAVGRAARAALAWMALSAAAPAAAQNLARAVAIYPLARGEGSVAEDAQALLESALQRAVNRTDDVVLSEPLVLRASCGPARTAPPDCLAGLAGSGLVLRAILHKSERSAAIAVEAVDGRSGRTVGPVTVGIDLYIQNAEPLARALLMLLDDVKSSARRQAAARPPPPPPPAVRTEPPAAKDPAVAAKEPGRAEPPAPKPDLRAAATDAGEAKAAAPRPSAGAITRAAPRRPFLRAAAPYVAGAGLAMLAGAAVVSMMNESISDELDRKALEGTLGPDDAARYRKVEQYNQLTLGLAAGGGALTLASAVMFTVVPSQGGATLALAGRF